MIWAVLSVIGWVLFAVVLIIVALLMCVVLAFVFDSMAARRAPEKYSKIEYWRVNRKGPGIVDYVSAADDFAQRSKKALLVLPGILAYRNQAEPLLPALDAYDVYAFRYAGLRYNRELLVDDGVAMVRWLLNRYDTVVLDGISHGGQGALYILEVLTAEERQKVTVILHEPPAGAATLKQVPGWAASLFLFTAGSNANFVLGVVPRLFAALGDPKRETVKTPCNENMYLLTGKIMTPNEYFDWVVKCAKQNLSGHKFSMWYSEIGDMVRSGKEGLPYDVLNDVRCVTYIEYHNDKNDVIREPDAAWAYMSRVSRMQHIMIDGTHAGFLDFNDENIAAIKEALP